MKFGPQLTISVWAVGVTLYSGLPLELGAIYALVMWYCFFNVVRWFQKKEMYADTVVWSFRYEPNGPNIGRNIMFAIYASCGSLLSWGGLFVVPKYV